MAKRRNTCRKEPNRVSKDDHGATSPLTDIESNPIPATDLPAKAQPNPEPNPVKEPISLSALDAIDKNTQLLQPHPKRTRSRSGTDGTVPDGTVPDVQPPAKKKKTNTTSPVQRRNIGTSRSRAAGVPPRSPLPLRTNRVVNPGAPDKKNTRRTSAEVAAAAQQKKRLQLELERMEKEKIRMLAEMEAVEEEEQREEERVSIKDIADLEEPRADSEADTQYGNKGIAGDDDIVMADDGENKEMNDMFVDNEPEFEGTDTVKTVSKLAEDNSFLLMTVGVLFNRRNRLDLGGTFEQQLTRRKKCSVRSQGSYFFLFLIL